MNKKHIYVITCIILLIDQIIKIVVNHAMNLYDEIVIIKKFFSIYYLKNTGAAFSILENNTTFLIILSVIFVIILNRFIKEEKNLNNLSIISLGMIMGGIFGNLIDRIIHKGVIDYLSFEIFKYSFPVFNFADTAIFLGVCILILNYILELKRVK